MFVKYSKKKGEFFRRAVNLNGTYLVQEYDKIVAYAQLIRYVHASKKSERPDIPVYDVIVAGGEDADKVLRFLKRFIVNSEKWEGQQFAKRKYLVNHVETFDDVRFSINKRRI